MYKYELVKLLEKVLLVGNGGSLKDRNISDKIDSFDVVCRFNWGGSKISFDNWCLKPFLIVYLIRIYTFKTIYEDFSIKVKLFFQKVT